MIAGVLHLGNAPEPDATACGKSGLVLLGSADTADERVQDDTREGALVLCPDCERWLMLQAALDMLDPSGIIRAAQFLADHYHGGSP